MMAFSNPSDLVKQQNQMPIHDVGATKENAIAN
jgi:hypothetical protein